MRIGNKESSQKSLLDELIRNIETFDGVGSIMFEYQNRKIPFKKASMEFKCLRCYETLEDDREALLFGLWNLEDGERKPIGILYGMIDEFSFADIQSRTFSCGSRSRTASIIPSNSRAFYDLYSKNMILPPDFRNLGDISSSDYAFEIHEDWRDGQLSQIFLGIVLAVMKKDGIKSATFNSDRTSKDGKTSFYTRIAKGEVWASSKITTIISTDLTPEHKDLLKKFIV